MIFQPVGKRVFSSYTLQLSTKKSNALFCSFHRRYGTKCSGCGHGISPSDLVRKAREKVFHLNCFTCLVCRKQLSTGEELYVLDDNKFICKEDYLAGKAPTQCEFAFIFVSKNSWCLFGSHVVTLLSKLTCVAWLDEKPSTQYTFQCKTF